MSPRSIAAALALVAGACFHDEAPRDPSATFTSTTAAASGETSGPGVTTSAATSDEGTSTGAVEPTTSTTDATTSTTDATTSTTEASMSMSMSMSEATTEATTLDPVECGDTQLFECFKCCADANPGSKQFYEALGACACAGQCKDSCKEDLCAGKYPADACLLCTATMNEQMCLMAANSACKADPNCAPFLDCIMAVPCM